MQRHLIPAPLREGDLVAVVAPSGPFDEARYLRGAAWLASRYRLRVREDVHQRRGYLAGDEARRRAELEATLADPEVKAVVAARGV
jgi:muramoyltetrapeptide carboxypeptidase